MTIDEFSELVGQRIPSPSEFVAFAAAQGWEVRTRADGTAALRVPDTADELAQAFARMLSREPYRTNVLTVLEVAPPATRPQETPTAGEPVPPAEDPGATTCGVCRATVYTGEGLTRADVAAVCPNGGSREVRDRSGLVTQPAKPPCPWRTPGAG